MLNEPIILRKTCKTVYNYIRLTPIQRVSASASKRSRCVTPYSCIREYENNR